MKPGWNIMIDSWVLLIIIQVDVWAELHTAAVLPGRYYADSVFKLCHRGKMAALVSEYFALIFVQWEDVHPFLCQWTGCDTKVLIKCCYMSSNIWIPPSMWKHVIQFKTATQWIDLKASREWSVSHSLLLILIFLLKFIQLKWKHIKKAAVNWHSVLGVFFWPPPFTVCFSPPFSLFLCISSYFFSHFYHPHNKMMVVCHSWGGALGWVVGC